MLWEIRYTLRLFMERLRIIRSYLGQATHCPLTFFTLPLFSSFLFWKMLFMLYSLISYHGSRVQKGRFDSSFSKSEAILREPLGSAVNSSINSFFGILKENPAIFFYPHIFPHWFDSFDECRNSYSIELKLEPY